MNETSMLALITFFKMIPTSTAIGGAIYIMARDQSGWGWLLFVAVILGTFTSD